jgi:hypothetical protein
MTHHSTAGDGQFHLLQPESIICRHLPHRRVRLAREVDIMPVTDRLLAQPQNSFIAVTEQASVGQALAALLAHEGRDWWHLVVRRSDNTWAATTAAQIYAGLADRPGAGGESLAAWNGLVAANVVEQNDVDDWQARSLALSSPGGLVVVLAGGAIVGVVYGQRRQTNLSPLSTGQLTQLAGEAINLKDYGAILLAASKKSAPPSRAGA